LHEKGQFYLHYGNISVLTPAVTQQSRLAGRTTVADTFTYILSTYITYIYSIGQKSSVSVCILFAFKHLKKGFKKMLSGY